MVVLVVGFLLVYVFALSCLRFGAFALVDLRVVGLGGLLGQSGDFELDLHAKVANLPQGKAATNLGVTHGF